MRNQRVMTWGLSQALLYLCLGLFGTTVTHATATLTYSTVFSFDLSKGSGGVVEANNTLFGTLSNTSLTYGGAIYKVSLDGGVPQTIFQFSSTDGYLPIAGLLVGADGHLYGSTMYGARSTVFSLYEGGGTLFRVSQDGTDYQTLHRFDSNITNIAVVTGGVVATNYLNADGLYPSFPLIEDSGSGYLYGVTNSGGVHGTGVVFRVKTNGTDFQVLHTFAALATDGSSTEGAFPSGPLLLGHDGRLYGVTSHGGANLYSLTNKVDSTSTVVTKRGTGTVYSLNKDGSDFQTIFNFPALDDTLDADANTPDLVGRNDYGAFPSAGLVETSAGVLVGTTTDGGKPTDQSLGGLGTIYQLHTDGTYAGTTSLMLLSFDMTTGYTPTGRLVLKNGRLYGINASGNGSVFSIQLDGTGFISEHEFSYAEGVSPSSGLALASNGDLVGVTAYGGACNSAYGSYGSAYRLSANGVMASGYSNCTVYATSSGGGAMSQGWLWGLTALLVVSLLRKRWLSVH